MKTTRCTAFVRLLFAFTCFASAGTAQVHAFESLVVTTLVDEDNGTSHPNVGTGTSLREAINTANGDGDDTVINFSEAVFAAPRKTITLGGTPLPTLISNGTLTITYPTAGVEISGGGVSRVFQVAAGANVAMNGLTIRNGNAGVNFGGGVENAGTLTLNACTLRDNSANSGGAIS